MSYCVRVLLRPNNWLEVNQGYHNYSVDLDYGFKVHLFILALYGRLFLEKTTLLRVIELLLTQSLTQVCK